MSMVKRRTDVIALVDWCGTVVAYKYVAVTLDRQLNYSKHVANMVSRASLKLKQFRRMHSFLNTKAAILVYKSMLLPLLEYGNIFFPVLQLRIGRSCKCCKIRDFGVRLAAIWTSVRMNYTETQNF